MTPSSSEPPFADRVDAGRQLAERLIRLVADERIADPVVVGMARGGVPVAAEVARALRSPLDVAIVHKIGAPSQRELAIGAIAEGGDAVLDGRHTSNFNLDDPDVAEIVRDEREHLARRSEVYRSACPEISLRGRDVILIDDGLATGFTAAAAVRSMRDRGAARIVLAVPVCPAEALDELIAPAPDEFVHLIAPRSFYAVGLWYRDFPQVSDAEVLELLGSARASAASERREIAIEAGSGVQLTGDLTVPAGPWGIVLFAHGSGSSRLSPRNRMVADRFAGAGLATLLFDLLDDEEAQDRANVFDIGLLAGRLLSARRRLREEAAVRDLPVGLFGASTGAAAALCAAADPEAEIVAVVSRGGRPDLAADQLPLVAAPTLLIVGGADTEVLALNEAAMKRMTCQVELEIVPGAHHLFEAPGELEQVAELALAWFRAATS